MELTIYSKNFEDKEDVSQNGFADNVFVEDYNDGISFYNCDDNLCDAIKYIVNENIDIDKLQDGVNSLSKAVSLFSDLFVGKGKGSGDSYKPRAIYKRFED